MTESAVTPLETPVKYEQKIEQQASLSNLVHSL